MSPEPAIVVFGSLNADLVVRTPSLPRAGETVIGRDFAIYPGGKGANQAVAAARAGGRVAMFGRVGADPFGERLRAGLEADGVAAEGVVVDPEAPTGVAMIWVDDRGENGIVVAPGANHRVGPEDVARAEPWLARAACLLVQLEVPADAVAGVMAAAHRHGVRIIFDPAPAPPRALGFDAGRLLEGCFAVTPNLHEAAALTGLAAPGAGDPLAFAEAAAQHLAARGVAHAVVTLGARGAYWWDAAEGAGRHLPAPPVQAVDATAAGDAFAGALAVALGEGYAFPEALRFAQAAGAMAATRPGAQPSLPARPEIERLLA